MNDVSKEQNKRFFALCVSLLLLLNYLRFKKVYNQVYDIIKCKDSSVCTMMQYAIFLYTMSRQFLAPSFSRLTKFIKQIFQTKNINS